MQAKNTPRVHPPGATACTTALFDQYFYYFTDNIIILPIRKHARQGTFPSFFTYFTNFTNEKFYIE